TLGTLVATNVITPVVTWAVTRKRNNAAAVLDEADAAHSLSATVTQLSQEIAAMQSRLTAAESRASAAESRLAAAEARAAVADSRASNAEAEVARLRGEVAGLRVEVEQYAAREKRLTDQLAALEGGTP